MNSDLQTIGWVAAAMVTAMVVALITILGCLAALLLARETAGAFPPAGRAVWGLFWRSRWLLLALLYPWIALFLWG